MKKTRLGEKGNVVGIHKIIPVRFFSRCLLFYDRMLIGFLTKNRSNSMGEASVHFIEVYYFLN